MPETVIYLCFFQYSVFCKNTCFYIWVNFSAFPDKLNDSKYWTGKAFGLKFSFLNLVLILANCNIVFMQVFPCYFQGMTRESPLVFAFERNVCYRGNLVLYWPFLHSHILTLPTLFKSYKQFSASPLLLLSCSLMQLERTNSHIFGIQNCRGKWKWLDARNRKKRQITCAEHRGSRVTPWK